MDEFKRHGILLQGFDLLDVVEYIDRTNKKFQATLLSQLEEEITDKEIFMVVRKLVLDSTNNFVRTIVKKIYGDIEF
jgi:hypothetical protein